MTGLLVDQLRAMAGTFPNETAYVHLDTGDSLTFEAWSSAAARLARGIVARKVERGDRVAIDIDASEPLAWIVAYAAVHMAGAVAVPVNTRLSGPELAAILGHAEPVAAVVSPACATVLEPAAARLPSLRLVIRTAEPTGDLADPDSTQPKDRLPPGVTEVAWNEVLDVDGSPFQVPTEPDDLADIMYTSGTTGLPKGVAVRHHNAAMIPNSAPSWLGEGWIHASPLFTFAGIASVYNPMKLGMTGLYLSRFDTDRWLDAVEARRPTCAFLVPAMAQLLVHHPRFPTADLSSLHLVAIGSAPLSPATLLRLQERLPEALVSNSYGMTEAGPAYCTMSREDALARSGSVGRPVPPTEIKVVDELGNELPPGETGELLLHPAGRPREYYRDPDATADTWVDGWLHTGDVGHLDADGFLFLTGRLKDVIIRGGNNIHAADVEAVLLQHPGVLEAAVAGVPHEVLGQDVAAFVVPLPGHRLTSEGLDAFARERLADYKVPRHYTFLDELPRNATGKVIKAKLAG